MKDGTRVSSRRVMCGWDAHDLAAVYLAKEGAVGGEGEAAGLSVILGQEGDRPG